MSGSLVSRLVSVSHPRKVWLLTGAHGVNEFYNVALPPILPLLVTDFAISYGEAGALITVFFVVYSALQLPAGLLADRVGQRSLLAAGMVVLSGGMLLAAGAQTYETLLAAEALAGVGGATYHPTGMSLISDLETGDTEGRAMGVHGFGGVVGTALAPALIGGLAAVFDWRLALTAAAGVGLAYTAAFLALFSDVAAGDAAPDPEPDGGTAADAAEGATGTGATDSTTADAPESATGAAGADTAPRGWRERVGTAVAVPRERWVAVLFVANLAISTQVGAVRTFVTTYLVERASMTAGAANGVFFVMLVGAGISSIGGGSLADSVDRRRLGVGLMVASAAGLAATAAVPVVPALLVAWFFLLGLVLWAAIPTMNALTSGFSEREFSGSLFGVMLTAGSLGGAGGPLLFGVAAERVGVVAAFPLMAGVGVVGAVAFLALGPPSEARA